MKTKTEWFEFGIGAHINRPRRNPVPMTERIAQAQKHSLRHRNKPITMQPAPWEEELADAED